jgi:hypothetical protein
MIQAHSDFSDSVHLWIHKKRERETERGGEEEDEKEEEKHE